MTALDAMPWIGAPACEWHPQATGRPCGQPATWHLTTHDFTHLSRPPDPSHTRTWMICADCALNVMGWAKQAHADGEGFSCKVCRHDFVPALGAFIKSHGEIADKSQDVSYG